ncbi:2OG-Fe(II) oxygenase family protein [Alisedimentitalea sp. MJ-SS2]|uniref:isopenicillin N synthase family dioxygenase n=1 Tax=Aliisedimentitalea sp. MJ-SS2 TaxID=3049795 RepID=UPI00291092F4|nr:2OG-Fe(II) oxygenase family protein [Alisedimentitalea sp. MJ-SS2]MDU8926677.1 2OG-Fe(II) oxygenase family protein [Alisedimentitalea sp. MJ-SS2]
MSTSDIPIIDLATTPDLPAAFARAYGEVGFGYIIGHGIDPALRAQVFDMNRRFHDQPLETKMQVELDGHHRGYIPINTSTDVNSQLAEVTKPNQSESFMMMREDAAHDPAHFLSGPNQWPDLPGFRETLEAYHTALLRLGHSLIQIALAATGATPQAQAETLQAFDTPTTWLRLLHYPPSPPASAEDLYGSAPHTDFGALTILAQDDVGGLQVQTETGDWIDAPPIPDAFVVNVGDMLHRMSNGRLKSTPHRVINRSGHERYSVPFFYDPHVSTTVTPLPGTGTPNYDPLNFDNFLRAELGAAYDHHKSPPKG